MPDFKPMLAHSKSPDPATLRYPLLVQPKLDGIRASVVNGKLVSRTLKSIPNREISDALSRPEFEGLDGELIVGDPRDPAAYRNTTTFVMAEAKTGAPWTFFVFDLWNHGGAFRDRLDAAWAVVKPRSYASERVSMVATVEARDASDVENVEAMLLAQGYEGAILRQPDGLYKFGRSGKTGPLLKLKRYVDFEAEVVGVYEEMRNDNVATRNALGRTERSSHKDGKVGKGTLGGLVLRAINGPAEGVEFRCGTGFDARTRQELWGAALIGHVAKVKSFPIGVKDKPRHPVFLGWRDMEVDG